jgi:anti-sigma regulatory factor (Ser/Thr protein kinase)
VLFSADAGLVGRPGVDGEPLTHAATELGGCRAPQRLARRMVRETLAGSAVEVRTDDLVLVADELVGNAVQHVGAALAISLDVYPWGLAMQVRDCGGDTAGVKRRPCPASDDESGRGLLLVDLLTSAWVVQRDGDGKRVVAIFLHGAGDAE